jgi:hypothetical protein
MSFFMDYASLPSILKILAGTMLSSMEGAWVFFVAGKNILAQSVSYSHSIDYREDVHLLVSGFPHSSQHRFSTLEGACNAWAQALESGGWGPPPGHAYCVVPPKGQDIHIIPENLADVYLQAGVWPAACTITVSYLST